MPFSAKMTKMPLVNTRFDRRSNEVKISHKTTFFIVLHQTRASWIFLTMPLRRLSNSHSNDYSWVEIGVKTAKISQKLG